MQLRILALVAAAVICLPAMGRAQSATTGAIAGVVKDTTGAVLPGVTVGVTAGGTAGNGSAVGGTKGEGHDTTMSIHGSRPGDMQTRLDGMNINATGSFGGGFRHQGLNQAAIQETVVETDGSTAASE